LVRKIGFSYFMTPLQLAIYKTIVWFDQIGHPLTLWECWYYLWAEAGQPSLNQVSLSEVRAVLINFKTTGQLATFGGFWSLNGRASLVTDRLRKNRWAIIKYEKALKGAKLLARLPFIKLVALVNTMSWAAPQKDSDVDFFIITSTKRIFTGRLLVSALTQFVGWRRHGRKINNRLCLSFYVSQMGQNLSPLAYPDDPYLRFWLLALKPLYVDKLTYVDFIKENSWLKKDFPNYDWIINEPSSIIYSSRVISFSKQLWESLFTGVLGDWLEYFFKTVQVFYMAKFGRGRFSRRGDGSSAVVVNDQVLKFHESDARPNLAKAFRQRLAKI